MTTPASALKDQLTGVPTAPVFPGLPFTEFPPKAEKARLDGYKVYQAVYDGEYKNALNRQLLSEKELYIVANLPRLIVTIPSDLMLGEPFSLDLDEAEDAQEVLDDIVLRSNLQTTAYEMSVAAGILGDQLLVPEKNADGDVTIRVVAPHVWFPERNPDNLREVLIHRFCWVRETTVEGVAVKFLRVIEHEKGIVRNRLFELRGKKIVREVPMGAPVWQTLYPAGDLPEAEQDTGVDDFLVVHVPNARLSSDFYGRSDLRDLLSMFAALYARLSQTNQILRRHADPSQSVPPQMFAWLRGQPGTESGSQGAVIVDPELLKVQKQGDNGEKTEYMTWDGKIENSLAFVTELKALIFMLAEIDRQLVEGIEGAPSGVALRTLLVRTLAKVNRKWKYVQEGLEKALKLAAQFQGVEIGALRIERSDGLPADTEADVRVAIDKIQNGLSTQLREIMRLEDMEKSEAEELLKEIEAAQDVARNNEAMNSAATSGNKGVTPNNNPIQVKVAV